jgi:hypothetical protein
MRKGGFLADIIYIFVLVGYYIHISLYSICYLSFFHTFIIA